MHTSQNERGTAKERFTSRSGNNDVREYEDDPAMPAIERYLAGLNFPATRQNVLDASRRNNAPEYVLEMIEELPDREFGSHADLSRAMDSIEW